MSLLTKLVNILFCLFLKDINKKKLRYQYHKKCLILERFFLEFLSWTVSVISKLMNQVLNYQFFKVNIIFYINLVEELGEY